MNRDIINTIINNTSKHVFIWNKYSDSSCYDTYQNNEQGYIICLYETPTGKIITIGVTDDWGVIQNEINVPETDPCFADLLSTYKTITESAIMEGVC